MKTVAFLAERQIEFLMLVALIRQEPVDRIESGVGTSFSKSPSASPRMMGRMTKGTEFSSTFQSQFFVPGSAMSAVAYWIAKRIFQKRRYAVVPENQSIDCHFLFPFLDYIGKQPGSGCFAGMRWLNLHLSEVVFSPARTLKRACSCGKDPGYISFS
jgi:hypothetical protein